MSFIFPDNCLAVFVDDTGHEALVNGQPVYGLGGCAVMACNLERVICQPWREVRQRITGSVDTQLHASKFSQDYKGKSEPIEIIAEFFKKQMFFRFGAIISTETKLIEEFEPVQLVAKTLQNRIVDICNWTPCKEIRVIIESSDRANSLVKDAFQGFELSEDGKQISVECYFMPKSAAYPALEVADFVMHAVGRQARKNLKKREDFLPEFKAVFHSVDRRLTSFMEVQMVTKTSNTIGQND